MVRNIKAKLVLRLRSEGLTGRQIAAQGMSRTSVAAVIDAADREGVGWDDVAALNEADVYARLFPGRGEHESVHAQPDWDRVHRELARVGVTLKLLHGEYVDACRAGGETAMGYDRFCKTYQGHVLVIGAASRVGHKAGQTVEVDWSGKTMALTDPVTDTTTRVYLFVTTLPFSRYSFVEPTLDMRQDTWLRANAAMFALFGGSVPRIVPDNLKTGVIKHPAEGEVLLNDAYRELAAHYSAAVLPGRLAKPKDKASVEGTVGNVATVVIAALRNQQFATLPELRAAVYERVAAYNAEPFQKRAGSRLTVFEAEEKQLLRPLPAVAFEISQWFYGRKVQERARGVRAQLLLRPLREHWPVGRPARHRHHDRGVHRGSAAHQPPPRPGRGGQRVPHSRQRSARRPPLPADGPRTGARVGGKDWGEHHDDREPDLRIRPRRRAGPGRCAGSAADDETRYSAARVEAAAGIALQSRVRSPRYAHLRPILESNQDQAGRRLPRLEPGAWEEPVGYVRGADYYAGDAR